jgi:RluA family pseudouridine synthase
MYTGFSVLHDDENLLIVNKRPGFAVIPGRGISDDIVLVKLIEKQLGVHCFVVHRIDLETSGIVLFAKNSQAHRYYSMQFEHREVQKAYLALVLGTINGDIVIDSPIRQFGSGRMGVDPSGKPSLTQIKIVERLQSATLIDVNPKTGRRHQIRVHCYSIGHPIIGDPLYGKDRPVGGVSRLMLHAYQLRVKDFNSGNERIITAGVDEQWNEIVCSLQMFGKR